MRVIPLIGLLVCAGCGSSTPLPDHTYTSDPLSAGSNRVQVVVTSDINRAECQDLISQYSSMAGGEGQVSVHKPSASLGGRSAPWCVDNKDGTKVRFNDALFQ